jgi:hypothetical protein
MSDSKPFLTLTCEAARLAVREYFRPLVAFYRFFRPLPRKEAPAESIQPATIHNGEPQEKRHQEPFRARLDPEEKAS